MRRPHILLAPSIVVGCLALATLSPVAPVRADDGRPPSAATKVVPIDSVCRSANATDTRTAPGRQRQPASTHAHEAVVCAPVINVMPWVPASMSVPPPFGTSTTPKTGEPKKTGEPIKTEETKKSDEPKKASEPNKAAETKKIEETKKTESTKFGFDFAGLFKADFQSADMTFVWAAFVVVVVGAIALIAWNHIKAKNQPEKEKAKLATRTIVLVLMAALLTCLLLSIRFSNGGDVEAFATRIEQIVARRASQLEGDATATANAVDAAAQIAALRAELAIRDAQYASDRRLPSESVDAVPRSAVGTDVLLLLVLVAGIASVAFAITKRSAFDRDVSYQLRTLDLGQERAREKLDGVVAHFVDALDRRDASDAAAEERPPSFAAIHRVEDEADFVRRELARPAIVPVAGVSVIEIDPLFVALTQLRTALEPEPSASGELPMATGPTPTPTSRPALRRPIDEKAKSRLETALDALLTSLARRVEDPLAWRTDAIVRVRDVRRLLQELTPPQGPVPPLANTV